MINSQSKLAHEFWEYGYLKSCPIIDFHAHMGNMQGAYMPAGYPNRMLKLMERSNVIMTCFISHNGLYRSSKYAIDDINMAKEHPDKFRAYYGVMAEHNDFHEDIKVFEANRDSLVGFKFHSSSHKYPINGELNIPYFEYANKNKLLVLAHTWDDDIYNGPVQVEMILEKYPDIIFIAGHSFYDDFDSAIMLANKYPNMFLELTAVLPYRGALERLVNEAGSHRILFGCDMPWFSYFHSIGAILSADITDDDRKNIFYKNGMTLLDGII